MTAQMLTAARVLDAIDAGAPAPQAVARVAAELAVGHDRVTRVFREHVGVSPTRYAQHRRAEAARRRLVDRSVLDAAVELDESSTGRLHDLVVTVEAVTPGEARRGGEGVVVDHAVHDSPFGPLLVATTARGVVQLAFVADAPAHEALDDLRRRWPAATLRPDADATRPAAEEVVRRLGGRRHGPLPLLLRGTNLQLAVWRALLRIPEGACTSYGTLAEVVGRPTAVRAVASAVGRNPVAPVVPCHRVLRATGALGGYRWGEDVKRRLLAVEAARVLGTADAA